MMTAAMTSLVDAVAAVRGQVPADLPGPLALSEAAVLLRRELEVLGAVVLARLADVDARQLHELADSASTGSWVEQPGTSLGRGQVALARRLGRMPCVSASVLAGQLTVTAAEKVGRALDALRPHVDRPDGLIDGQDGEQVLLGVVLHGVGSLVGASLGGLDDDDPVLLGLLGSLRDLALDRTKTQIARLEQAFLLLAEHTHAGSLAADLSALVDAVLPVHLHERAQRGHDERGLRLVRKSDGSGFTVRRGDLDLQTGELLLTVLQAVAATDPDSPADTAAWNAQTGGPTGPAPRTRGQQHHDALRLALRCLLDSGALGVRGKQAPHLDVTVSLLTLHGTPGALPARTPRGTAFPISQLAAWLPDSHLTRVVLGLGGRVLDISHTERTLRHHERRALAHQWGHRCADAHCHAPPGIRTVPHHATAWATCGTTSLADTVPLCERSHQDLHVGGRVLHLRDGRRLGPQGWATPAVLPGSAA